MILTRRKLTLFALLLLGMSLLIVACGGGGEEVAEEPTVAAPEPAAPEPAATDTPEAEAMEEMEPCAPATEGPLAGIDPRGQTVVWWHNHSGSREEQLMELLADYNENNECGIIVDATNQGSYNDIRDKVNASIGAGEIPATLLVGYQNDQAFYQLNDTLVDLNEYVDDPHWGLTAEEKADFFPTFFNQSIHPAFDNQRLGFPPNRSLEVIFYNQTWLEELGFDAPPDTPEEFREMSCAAAEANGDGTGGFILRDDASGTAAWTFAYGGNVLSEDGTSYVYNGQATIDALTFVKGMLDDGCAWISPENFHDAEFANRQAIFYQGSSSGMPFTAGSMATVAEEMGHDADVWGVSVIPHTTPDPVMNIYGGDVMIAHTTPEQQLAAWIFIKYFTSPEAQAKWVAISNYFPTRAGTGQYLDEYISQSDFGTPFQQALDLLQYGTYEPQLISYQGVRDATQEAFNAIMQGADIQATLDELTDTANDLQAELMSEVNQ